MSKRASAERRWTGVPELPWRGEYVFVLEPDVVRFHTCVRCGRALRGARVQVRGWGDECGHQEPEASLIIARDKALANDRQRFRQEHDAYRASAASDRQRHYLLQLGEQQGDDEAVAASRDPYLSKVRATRLISRLAPD